MPAAASGAGRARAGVAAVFPTDNWWNTDISSAPVDANSASFINFIGGTRSLHPDFGGEESPGSATIYGIPVRRSSMATQPKQAVTFEYWDESDGVDYATGQGVPFYPIPAQAITQPHWVEGGAPGNVDQRSDSDRHLLMVDCTNKHVCTSSTTSTTTRRSSSGTRGSGAFFDLNTQRRRPEGWTSADAAGLAIFPGLVRYDEAANPAVRRSGTRSASPCARPTAMSIPASHRAGSTAGALPMGARLRLKTSVNGLDPALRTSDPIARKIFRAMQKYGLIVADNGSDMYITGTFDVRWNNDVLNPAFALLEASDFEVVQLGWKPPASTAPSLNAVSASPNPVIGGQSATGTVTLSAAAPTGGAVVSLAERQQRVLRSRQRHRAAGREQRELHDHDHGAGHGGNGHAVGHLCRRHADERHYRQSAGAVAAHAFDRQCADHGRQLGHQAGDASRSGSRRPRAATSPTRSRPPMAPPPRATTTSRAASPDRPSPPARPAGPSPSPSMAIRRGKPTSRTSSS